jgi:hypothetical protein
MPVTTPIAYPGLLFVTAQQLLRVRALSLYRLQDHRSHSDTRHSGGFLWTSDQPGAETCTWKHITLATNTHAPGKIRTHNPKHQAAATPRLTQRGHWGRLFRLLFISNKSKTFYLNSPSMFWKVNKNIQIICTFYVTLYYYQSFIIRLVCQTHTFYYVICLSLQ